MTNPLISTITRMVKTTGPLSIAEYMHLCHAHPKRGYYTTGRPIGAKGDFITAPEISQMFGELIGIWCIQKWQQMGKPDIIQIAELGPGNGTLMLDILRTIKMVPDFLAASRIKLVETSPSLKSRQRETLADFADKITHTEKIADLTRQPTRALPTRALPTLFIANEFFDAIPFRQFIKTGNDWLENCVTIDAQNKLHFAVIHPSIEAASLPADHASQPEGAIFEFAPAREAIVNELAIQIKAGDGAALIIDYGHEKSGFGDTFQGVRNHQFASPLENPGQTDLTSHVDFESLAQIAAASGIVAKPLQTQGDFLLEMGLLERAGNLGAGKSQSVQDQITSDVERLASPQQMGTLFKVLSLEKRAENI